MSPDTHVHIPHPEMLMPTLAPPPMADLRTPVGQHIRRTIEATDRRVPDGSGVALGVIVCVVFFVALGGVAWGLHAAGVYLP